MLMLNVDASVQDWLVRCFMKHSDQSRQACQSRPVAASQLEVYHGFCIRERPCIRISADFHLMRSGCIMFELCCTEHC